MTENTKITAALIKLQGDLENVKFDAVNPHFKNKYSSLAGIREELRKPLADNKLAITQTFRVEGDKILLVTTLRHESGETVSGEYPIHAGTPQQQGSAISYARRYSISALLNLASDDDDGEASEGRNSHVEPSRASQRGQRPNVTAKQPALIDTAEKVAGRGLAQLADWWSSLVPADQKALEGEKLRLKGVAEEADKEREALK